MCMKISPGNDMSTIARSLVPPSPIAIRMLMPSSVPTRTAEIVANTSRFSRRNHVRFRQPFGALFLSSLNFFFLLLWFFAAAEALAPLDEVSSSMIAAMDDETGCSDVNPLLLLLLRRGAVAFGAVCPDDVFRLPIILFLTSNQNLSPESFFESFLAL